MIVAAKFLSSAPAKRISLSFLTKTLSVALLCAVFSACTSSSVEEGESTLSVAQRSYSTNTDGSGQASFTFDIPASSAFHITAQTGAGYISLTELKPLNGGSLLDNGAAYSTVAESGSTSASYPCEGGSLQAGRYQATSLIQTGGRRPEASPNQDVALTVSTKVDSDLNSGTLRVNIVLVGAVGGDSEARNGLENALDIWKQIYERAGIALDPAWYNFEGPEILPDPRVGSSFYESVASAMRPDAVNVVVGSRVSGLSAPNNRFGIAAGKPGPVVASPKSAVAISFLSLTGPDGQFDLDIDQDNATTVHNDEQRLAAEEMARLTAQYLGLEHVVELSNSRVVNTDSFNDTASCLTLVSCQYEEGARGNLMFPFPLRKLGDYPRGEEQKTEYYPRDQISPQQAAALNASVLVD